ncbi:MAG: hypothetical protein Q8S13_14605, partial [Dehalococcoidia bacterium]|nr:hypothetical protein [Dehalococcoidia bacterium]
MPVVTNFDGDLDFERVTAAPTTAPTRGSLAVRTDAGFVGVYQNIDGTAAGWVTIGALSSGTWLLTDNSATALVIGATGDLDMMTFDTTNGAEVVSIGSTLGFRLNDNSPLRLGTPGTDVVLTPDGTDVVVTATGIVIYNNDVVSALGTLANDRFSISYNLANTRGQISGASITAGGATQATRGFRIETGARNKNDANAGVPASGNLDFFTGATSQTTAAATGGVSGTVTVGSGSTDSNFAGAVGGASGGVTISSGVASSTIGTSGATGIIQLLTGVSDDANTGNIVLTTGAASAAGAVLSGNVALSTGAVGGTGTTGNITFVTGNAAGAGVSGNIVLTVGTAPGGTPGIFDINVATIDLVTQATFLDLIDNTAAALSMRAGVGGPPVFVVGTTNGAETVAASAITTTTDAVPAGLSRRVGGSVLRTVAESATVANVEGIFAGGTVTLPANSLLVGSRVSFTALIRVASVSTAPTARVQIKLNGTGGTLVFDTVARTVADEDIISLAGYIDLRSTGAPGTATGTCNYRISAADALASVAAAE